MSRGYEKWDDAYVDEDDAGSLPFSSETGERMTREELDSMKNSISSAETEFLIEILSDTKIILDGLRDFQTRDEIMAGIEGTGLDLLPSDIAIIDLLNLRIRLIEEELSSRVH